MLSRFLTRKFVAATGTALLMALCWLASNWLPKAAEHLSALFAALGAALGAYLGSNVYQDHIMNRARPAEPPAEDRK